MDVKKSEHCSDLEYYYLLDATLLYKSIRIRWLEVNALQLTGDL